MLKKITKLGALASLVLPGAAFAAATAGPGPVNVAPIITSLTDVQTNVICKIVDWAFGFLIVFTILMVIWAAFRYLFSKGEGADKIHNQLIYAAVAIVVALLAKGFPLIVANFFNVGGFTGC